MLNIQPNTVTDVLLITMPFRPLRKPSIGLSLLQAGLRNISVCSKNLYFTLLFAQRIGIEPYERIADGPYSTAGQVGEWAFSSALYPGQDPHPYLETVLYTD